MDGPCPLWVTVPGSQGPHLCPLRRLPEKLRKLSSRSHQVGWGPRKPAHIRLAPGPSTGVSVQHRDPSPGVQACPLQQTPCSHRSPGVAGPPADCGAQSPPLPGPCFLQGKEEGAEPGSPSGLLPAQEVESSEIPVQSPGEKSGCARGGRSARQGPHGPRSGVRGRE